ncbi:hypothetical protein FFLO_06985 [Filobasidium floriforme]|uniref:Myb/SANT-like domain-containing protein n=1 Tax=Filobasidium floriforme TaxID=5210 RepID=A0A8K0JFU1_9TREE|nr:hypothetical protein FFLO_06985 [Filobasidium floriforme]
MESGSLASSSQPDAALQHPAGRGTDSPFLVPTLNDAFNHRNGQTNDLRSSVAPSSRLSSTPTPSFISREGSTFSRDGSTFPLDPSLMAGRSPSWGRESSSGGASFFAGMRLDRESTVASTVTSIGSTGRLSQRENASWTDADDELMVDLLLESVRQGQKSENGFKKGVWGKVVTEVNRVRTQGGPKDERSARGRYSLLRKEKWEPIHTMMTMLSGAGFDEDLGCVTLPEKGWRELRESGVSR